MDSYAHLPLTVVLDAVDKGILSKEEARACFIGAIPALAKFVGDQAQIAAARNVPSA